MTDTATTDEARAWARLVLANNPHDEQRKIARWVLDQAVQNPHLPEPPADGQHIFGLDGMSYRCSRCGVYNRPEVPSNKEVLDAPCAGRWAQSGKMRAWAEDKWRDEKAGQQL